MRSAALPQWQTTCRRRRPRSVVREAGSPRTPRAQPAWWARWKEPILRQGGCAQSARQTWPRLSPRRSSAESTTPMSVKINKGNNEGKDARQNGDEQRQHAVKRLMQRVGHVPPDRGVVDVGRLRRPGAELADSLEQGLLASDSLLDFSLLETKYVHAIASRTSPHEPSPLMYRMVPLDRHHSSESIQNALGR